MEGGRNST